MPTDHEERREAVRHDTHSLGVSGHIQLVNGFSEMLTPTGEPIPFQLLDLSRVGYRLSTNVKLTQGNHVLVRFEGLGSLRGLMAGNEDSGGGVLAEDDDLVCLGVVAWSKPTETGHELGVQLREDSLQNHFNEIFSDAVAGKRIVAQP